MLRTTVCALAALALSAGPLTAADTKGGKTDKSYPVILVKMEAAKHLLVFKVKFAKIAPVCVVIQTHV